MIQEGIVREVTFSLNLKLWVKEELGKDREE